MTHVRTVHEGKNDSSERGGQKESRSTTRVQCEVCLLTYKDRKALLLQLKCFVGCDDDHSPSIDLNRYTHSKLQII